jgi:hypothetical protein
MLVPGGVFTGSAVFVAYERVPIWSRMDVATYAVDFRRSLRRADPTQPVLLVLTVMSSVAFAVAARGAARALALAGAGCLVAVLTASLTLGEPINSQFRRRAEGVVPPDVEGLRRTWARLHVARATVAVVAFALLVAASQS